MPKALEDLLGVAVSGPSAEALAAISQPIPANLEAGCTARDRLAISLTRSPSCPFSPFFLGLGGFPY